MERKKSSSPFFFAFKRAEFYFSFIAPVLMREHDSWWCSDVIKKHNKCFMLHYIPCHRGFCSFFFRVMWMPSALFFCNICVKNSRAIHHEAYTKILFLKTKQKNDWKIFELYAFNLARMLWSLQLMELEFEVNNTQDANCGNFTAVLMGFEMPRRQTSSCSYKLCAL